MGRFRVDEYQRAMGANGQPLSRVCVMYAKVKSGLEVELFMSGSLPREGPVQAWVKKVGPATATENTGSISITLKPGDQAKLSELADALLETVAPGMSYDTPSFKHSCPETASGLERFQKVLDTVWKKPKAATKK
jgi:hypothetical protein